MSALEKLKAANSPITFDTTENEAEDPVTLGTPDNSINIDAVSGTDIEDSDVNSVSLGSIGRGNHQIVNPKPIQPHSASTEDRHEVNIHDVGKSSEDFSDIKENPSKELLDLDNPDSMFRKYAKEKEDEAKEWIAEKQENDRILAEEKAANGEELTDSERGILFADSAPSQPSYHNDEALEDENLSFDNSKDDADSKDEYADEDDDNFDVDVTESNGYATEVTEESEDDENAADVDTDAILKHLQKLATEKIKPISKKLDISSFTVLKKPVASVSGIITDTKTRVAKWVLPCQESIVLMREFSGSELEKLREYSENSRSLDSLSRRFNMIYSHIASPKPASFETWLKTTPYEDVDHYFFAIYIANFKGANYLPEDCKNTKCKETFISDDIDIMRMVEFKDAKAKAKFSSIYESEAAPAGKGIYCTEVVPLSSKIAVSFRQPSIYNILEIAMTDDKLRSDYSATIDYIPYIDKVYYIDMDKQQLVPIGYKTYPDNTSRTVRSKIYKYHSVLSTLSIDEFAIIKAYAKSIADMETGINYIYPEIECPKCHTNTDKQNTTAEELVFTRYQLGTLVNTSLD